jgi:hypothetical protein
MLAISRRYVWALSPTNEIYCRHDIQPLSPAGDYWRKIPGIVSFISGRLGNEPFHVQTPAENGGIKSVTQVVLGIGTIFVVNDWFYILTDGQLIIDHNIFSFLPILKF